MTAPTTPPRRRWSTSLVVALAGGVALGALDLAAQLNLPYPAADLANSGAVWAAFAFAFGAWCRTMRPAAVGGAVLLVAAVEAYYVTASVAHGDDLAVAWSSTAFAWSAMAVVVGPLFAAAGVWARSPERSRNVAAAALLGGVFLAEVGWTAWRSYRPTDTLVITAVVGVVLAALTLAWPRARPAAR